MGHGGAISVTPASSKSAELLYEPSELTPARQKSVRSRGQSIGRRSNAALRWGLRARPPPDPSALTFLNWGNH